MLQRAGLSAALVIALLALAFPVQAQDAPPAVQAALAQLNAQLGTNLSLDDLTSWRWSRQNFPDRSLGCPQEGHSYPNFATNGVLVELGYGGIAYDFRVYSSNLQVFQCTPDGGAPGGTPANGTPRPADAPTLTPYPTSTPPAIIPTSTAPVTTGAIVCRGGLPARLAVGMRGQSVTNGSVNIRRTADLEDPDAVTGLLLPDAQFDVIGGPQCADNRTWWQIRYASAAGTTTGWVIEGDNVEYWLAPANLTAPPAASPTPGTAAAGTRAAITPANAAQLRLSGRYPVPQGVQRLAFLPRPRPDAIFADAAGQLHYYAGTNVARIDVSLNHPGLQARSVATAPKDDTRARVATLEVNPNAASGAVLYVSEIAGPSPLAVSELFGVQLPHLPNALAFSPDGRYLAASSGTLADADAQGAAPQPNLVWVWDVDAGQQLPTIQLDGPGADLAFSPDGRFLAIARPQAGVVVWSLERSEAVDTLATLPNRHGTPSLAFNPQGDKLAVGTVDGRVILYDMGDPQAIAPRTVIEAYADAEARFVAFDSTGSLLATGGVRSSASAQSPGENAGIAVWDAATGDPLATLSTDPVEPLTGLAFRAEDRQLIATGRLNWWTWGVF